jgi:hypothetical protein
VRSSRTVAQPSTSSPGGAAAAWRVARHRTGGAWTWCTEAHAEDDVAVAAPRGGRHVEGHRRARHLATPCLAAPGDGARRRGAIAARQVIVYAYLGGCRSSAPAATRGVFGKVAVASPAQHPGRGPPEAGYNGPPPLVWVLGPTEPGRSGGATLGRGGASAPAKSELSQVLPFFSGDISKLRRHLRDLDDAMAAAKLMSVQGRR